MMFKTIPLIDDAIQPSDRVPWAQAEESLQSAAAELQVMENPADRQAFERAWEAFVVQLELACTSFFSEARVTFGDSVITGHLGELAGIRKGNRKAEGADVVHYLVKCRDCASHNSQRATVAWTEPAWEFEGSGFIKNVVVLMNGMASYESKGYGGGPGPQMVLNPGSPYCLPAINDKTGAKVGPPGSIEWFPRPGPHPALVARVGWNFYKTSFDQLRDRFKTLKPVR